MRDFFFFIIGLVLGHKRGIIVFLHKAMVGSMAQNRWEKCCAGARFRRKSRFFHHVPKAWCDLPHHDFPVPNTFFPQAITKKTVRFAAGENESRPTAPQAKTKLGVSFAAGAVLF